MRPLCLLLLTFFTLTATAGVKYFAPGDTLNLPNINALEVRVLAPSPKPGKTSEWSINWPGTQITLHVDARNAWDEVTALPPTITLTAMGQTATAPKAGGKGDLHTVSIEWEGSSNSAKICMGNKERLRVMQLDSLPRPTGPVTLAGNASAVDLMLSTDDNLPPPPLNPLPSLAHWTLLDYESSKSNIQLGGEYHLGLLPTASGYDIIYLGGATICASVWQEGMRKGRLTKAGFENFFLLEWLNATGAPLYGRHYATLDPAQGLLTLQFPHYNTSLRFALSPTPH